LRFPYPKKKMDLGFIQLVKSLYTLFSLQGIGLLFISIALGLFIGSMPGLTAVMGVALLTGLTYYINIGNALILLIGVYVGAIAGGSISAILINVPGTGAAAATLLDGHPLALKGEAGPTIGLAAMSSTLGSFFSMAILFILTPLLSEFALKFTSIEIALLAIFGILICGSLTSEEMPIKGWISGLLGLLISYIGMDKITGYQRFCYDNPNLLGGVSFISCMIGLFGVPQVLIVMESQAHRIITPIKGSVIPKISYLFQKIKLILRSGLIGVIIGIVPGVGENVACFVSYDIAKKTSKEKDLFGKGSKEGVIAAETANNACVGGALIPLLALGVPGSPVTAVMIGAFLLHNIKPGPLLVLENPTIIYDVAAILLMASVALGILNLSLARIMAKVLQISPAIIMPVVAALCFIGAYAINLSVFDMQVVLWVGILAYFLRKMDYPPAPMALGIILGPIFDENLRRALMGTNGNILPFFTRPISLFLVMACIFSILNQSKWLKGQVKNTWERITSR
jgi:putative tricarboxylic transport membrane protein